MVGPDTPWWGQTPHGGGRHPMVGHVGASNPSVCVYMYMYIGGMSLSSPLFIFHTHTHTHTRRHATKSKPLEVIVDTSSCAITYLEHAQAITTLQLTKGHRQNVEILLQSPMETSSTLLPHRRRDFHSDGFHEWPFMTVHSWGEDPRGNWKFTVSVSSTDTEASLKKFTMVLLGTKETPRSVRNVPQLCHPECVGGCAGAGAEFCDTCKNFRLETNFKCVPSCPVGTYEDHHMCRSCPPLCSQCNKDTCIKCMDGAVILSNGGCSSSCESFTFLAPNSSCLPCHHSCMECNGPYNTSCTACPPQFTLRNNGACYVPTSCQPGEYFDSRSLECRLCHESCAECVGKGAQECTECYPGFVLDGGVCSVAVSGKLCAGGEYYEEGKETCLPCTPNCRKCTDDVTCLSCDSNYFLWTERIGGSQLEVSACIDHCPEGFHGDVASASCVSCLSYCTSCDSHDACTVCALDFATPVNGKCPQPCHDGEYFNMDTSQCLPCLANCLTCRNAETCLACQSSFYLIADTSCVQVCPEHLVEDEDQHICRAELCHDSCQTCFGEEPNQCLTCHENGKLFEHSCIEECPSHTYYDKESSSCQHCHESCLSCVGPSQDNCEQCPDEAFLSHFSCVTTCPEGTFVLNNTECVSCPANCVKCSSAEKCSTCKDMYLNERGKCVENCSLGFAEDGSVCKPCPSGCKECSQPDLCETCDEDMLFYKPDRSCVPTCPSGYYPVGSTCTECPTFCSECSGPNPSQCSLCSEGRAMDEETHTCIDCCNKDFPNRVPCCDCDTDHMTCIRQNTPPTTSVSDKSISDSHHVGLALTIAVVVLVASLMLGIGLFYAVTRLRWRTGVLYKPLQNHKDGELAATLALVEDSESGSDAELFAKTT